MEARREGQREEAPGPGALAPPPRWGTVAAWAAVALIPGVAAPREGPPPRVREVHFPGHGWIPPEALAQASGLRPGGEWTPEEAAKAVERILRLEFVASVAPPRTLPAGMGEVDVEIPLTVLPLIRSLRVEGSDAVPLQDLEEVLTSRAGGPLRDSDLRADRERLEAVCRARGFLLAHVESRVSPGPAGRVEVSFQVREGERVRLRRLQVLGNTALSRLEIEAATGLEPARLFGLLSPGVLRPKFLGDALESLRALYRSRGYLGAEVGLEEVRLSRGLTEAEVVLRAVEGPRYTIDAVRVEGHRLFPTRLLLEVLDLETGEFFDGSEVEAARLRLVRWYQEHSDRVPAVDVEPIYRDPPGRVEVLYTVREGKHRFAGAVHLRGNELTRDRVVRQHLEVVPGGPLVLLDLEESRKRLLSLGYFRDVQLDVLGEREEGVHDVSVTVEESEDLGFWQAGGGASSGEGEVAYFRVAYRNFDLFRPPRSLTDWRGAFTGGGQFIELGLVPGSRQSQFWFRFHEPWLGSALRALELDGTTFVFDRGPYDETRFRAEAAVRQFFEPSRRLSAALGYRADSVLIDDLDDSAPLDVSAAGGRSFLAYPRLSLRYRDLEVDPFSGPRGFTAEAGLEVAGALSGSERDFTRAESSAHLFWTLLNRRPDRRHLLHLGLQGGWVEGRGEPLPFYERFFLGGPRSFRGFGYRELGPHQQETPVGGTVMLHGTVEYSLPLYFREVRAAAIFDWGTLEESPGSFSTGRFRTAAGAGLELRLPLLGQVVPVNLYWVRALASARGDEEELFSFTLGYGF